LILPMYIKLESSLSIKSADTPNDLAMLSMVTDLKDSRYYL
jgi:hypothetical protein